jgi:hypothetical protein
MALNEPTAGQVSRGNGRNWQRLYPADFEENSGFGLRVVGIPEFHELLDVWLLIQQ